MVYAIVGIVAVAVIALAVMAAVRRNAGEFIDALVVNPATNEIRATRFYKVEENLYMSQSNPPIIMVLTGGATYTYRVGRRSWQVVLAIAHTHIAHPLEPRIAELAYLAQKAGPVTLFADGGTDIVSFIRRAAQAEEKQTRIVRAAPGIDIAIQIDLKTGMIQFVDEIFERASRTIQHILSSIAAYDKVAKMLEARARYEAVRFSWLRWLILIILVSAIAYIIIQYGMRYFGH